MSHWAQLDDNNTVIEILVGDNNDPNGDEGYQLIVDTFGGKWVKTSYNTALGVHKLGGTPFRKNYAVIGSTYDETRDAFIRPKPFESWTLNEDTCDWEAPISYPEDAKLYVWNESTLSWDEVI